MLYQAEPLPDEKRTAAELLGGAVELDYSRFRSVPAAFAGESKLKSLDYGGLSDSPAGIYLIVTNPTAPKNDRR